MGRWVPCPVDVHQLQLRPTQAPSRLAGWLKSYLQCHPIRYQIEGCSSVADDVNSLKLFEETNANFHFSALPDFSEFLDWS